MAILDDIDALVHSIHPSTAKENKKATTWPEACWQRAAASLHFFSEENTTRSKEPRPVLLICFALINNPGVLHVSRSRSFLQVLVDNGFDVFVLDWGSCEAHHLPSNDADMEAEVKTSPSLACVEEILVPASDFIGTLSPSPIHLVGVCQGAFFASLAAALKPERFASMTLMVAPCDTSLNNDHFAEVMRLLFPALEAVSIELISGGLISEFFLGLRPVNSQLMTWSTLQSKLTHDHFIAIEQWLHSGPYVRRDLLLEYMNAIYVNNELAKNSLELGGKSIDLQRMIKPVFNVVASRDTIVSAKSSQAFRHLFAEKSYAELMVGCGHLGIFIKPEIQHQVATALKAHCINAQRCQQNSSENCNQPLAKEEA